MKKSELRKEEKNGSFFYFNSCLLSEHFVLNVGSYVFLLRITLADKR